MAWFFSFPTCTSNNTLVKNFPSCIFASQLTSLTLFHPKVPVSSHDTGENLYSGVRITTCSVTTLDHTLIQKRDLKSQFSAPSSRGDTVVCTHVRQDSWRKLSSLPAQDLEHEPQPCSSLLLTLCTRSEAPRPKKSLGGGTLPGFRENRKIKREHKDRIYL